MNRVPKWLLVVLALIVVALIGLPMIHGVHPSGDLALGDGVVGAGTLLLAGATFWLASATFQIDKRAASREEASRAIAEGERIRRVNAIALQLDTELEVMQKTLESISAAGLWPSGAQIPRSAWDKFAEVLIAEITYQDALEMVRFFSEIDAWTHLLQQASRPGGPGQLQLQGGKGSLNDLLSRHTKVRSILRPLAYDRG